MFHLTFNILNTVLLPVTIYIGAFAILGVLEWTVAFLVIPQLENKQAHAVPSILK